MKIYISGKITGDPNFVEKFQKVEDLLISMNYEVINPVKLCQDIADNYKECMKRDIKILLECDSILMLNDWHLSSGSIVEFGIAKIIGLQIRFQSEDGDILWR